MPEPMKKPRTDANIVITLTGPLKNKEKALKLLKNLNYVNTSDSIPWREAFPEYDNIPSVCLSASRNKENLTQVELSKLTGISQRHISEMENGKRPIGKKTAKILAKALNVNYRVFL